MDRETRQSAFVAYAQCSIQCYTENDFLDVGDLWTDVICVFATPENIPEFKQYSKKAIEDELEHVAEQNTRSGGNAFWVCEIDNIIGGTVGIQRKNRHIAELRRRYLHRKHRGSRIAHNVLTHAEEAVKTLRYRISYC